MILALLAACSHHEPEVQAPPGHLTVLHTNDLHAHYLAEPAEWLPDRAAIGGFVRLDEELRALRSDRGPDSVLTLDSGDLNTGTPLGEIDVGGAKGAAMLQFMSLLHYDAWTLGNHEFDKGLTNLRAYTAQSKLPVLSANVHGADGSDALLPNQLPSTIFTRNGLRVGVIGVTTEGLGTLMSPADFQKVRLEPVADAVRRELTKLDPQTDLVIVLSHIGVDDDIALAEAVPGIDLIVGGHSHTRLLEPKNVKGTWIVQAGCYNRELGIDDLVVKDDAIAEFHYELRDLTPATSPGPARTEVQALADSYEEKVDQVYGEVIGTAGGLFTRDYHHESTEGRWIADVLRDAAHADVGLYNGGGLRADIAPGSVSLRTLYEAFPFGNQVMAFHLRGDELQGLVLRNAAAENDEKRGFLPISGVEYHWRVSQGAPELVDVYVGRKPLDLNASYLVAANSYIVEQWQKHLGVEPKDAVGVGVTDYEAAVAWVRAHPNFSPDTTPRAIRVQ